jgi:hypothetical protein
MRLPIATAFLLCVPTLMHAQEGDYWNTRTLPGPLTAPVVAFGTNITLRTATDVWVYSGVLHTWSQIPVSPAAVVYSEYNDHVIVRDGTSVHGWSTRTGAVTTISVSPSATVIAGTTGRTWTAAVVDGNTVHAYASFRGTWTTLATSSTPSVTLDKVTMVVQDSSNVYALSAFFGNFVSSPAATLRTVSENSAVTVDGSDVVRGFSALANTWTSHTFPGASSATLGLGFTFVLLQTPTTMLGFSAITRSFEEYLASGSMTTLRVAPEAAAFLDGGQVVGFSPSNCSFATQSVGGSPTLTPAENRFGSFVLASDGNDLHAFSGITGTFATLSGGPYSLSISDTSVFAQGASASYAYSAMRGQWYSSPVATGGVPTILYNGAIVEGGGALHAFSARSGSWSTLAHASATVAIHGSFYTSTSGNVVDIYDSRDGQWTSFTTTSAPNPWSVWRLMGITHDGVNAYGYSLFSNRPASVALQGAVQEYRANSEIAFVRTDTHIHVFTGVGSLSMKIRFPEHSRGLARGTPLFLQQTGPVGSVVRGALRLGDALRQGLPGRSPFQLGPHGAFPSYGVIPAAGVLDITLLVPPDPRLIGLQVPMMNVIAPPSGTAWMTNSVVPIVL